MRTIEDLKSKIRMWQNFIGDLGDTPERSRQEVANTAKLFVVQWLADKAFFAEVPRDQGPVWFGSEEWKTEVWQSRWDFCKAYVEGEKVRGDFGSREENPHTEDDPPFSMRKMELEAAWYLGFENKPF